MQLATRQKHRINRKVWLNLVGLFWYHPSSTWQEKKDEEDGLRLSIGLVNDWFLSNSELLTWIENRKREIVVNKGIQGSILFANSTDNLNRKAQHRHSTNNPVLHVTCWTDDDDDDDDAEDPCLNKVDQLKLCKWPAAVLCLSPFAFQYFTVKILQLAVGCFCAICPE